MTEPRFNLRGFVVDVNDHFAFISLDMQGTEKFYVKTAEFPGGKPLPRLTCVRFDVGPKHNPKAQWYTAVNVSIEKEEAA